MRLEEAVGVKPIDRSEELSLRYAAYFMVAASIIVAALRAYSITPFNFEVEICLFYLPTILLILVYLHSEWSRRHEG